MPTPPTNPTSFVLFSDGASRGNPGPASYGYVLLSDGEVVCEHGEKLGETTNNVAEYQGLIQGMAKALEMGVSVIEVRIDSELLVRQMEGKYRVKSPHLVPLFEQARSLFGKFKKAKIVHVRRELNQRADQLANLALDRP